MIPRLDDNSNSGRQLDALTDYAFPEEDDRSVFQQWQLDELEKCFISNHYPTKDQREEMARRLGTTERKLMIWFQNRRAKHRRKNQTRKRPGRPSLMNPPATCDGSPILRLKRNNIRLHRQEEISYSGDDELPPHSQKTPAIKEECFSETDSVHETPHGRSRSLLLEEGGPRTGLNESALSTPNHVWGRLSSPRDDIGSPRFHSTPVTRPSTTAGHPNVSDLSSTHRTPDSGFESTTTKSSIRTDPGNENSSLESKTPSRKRLSFSIDSILGITD